MDYFVLLIHPEVDGGTKRKIETHCLVLPAEDFKRTLQEAKKRLRKNQTYNVFIWINAIDRTATNIDDWKNPTNFTPYLKNFTAFP